MNIRNMPARLFLCIIPWLLIVCFKGKLKEDHPWKNKKTTLKWLAEGATPLTIQFGFTMWFVAATFIFLVCLTIYRHTHPA